MDPILILPHSILLKRIRPASNGDKRIRSIMSYLYDRLHRYAFNYSVIMIHAGYNSRQGTKYRSTICGGKSKRAQLVL